MKIFRTPQIEADSNCYQDFDDRILKSPDGISSSTMTIDMCTNHCFGKNYLYAGVQYYSTCHCGNEISRKVVRPQSECNTPCEGNSNQMCGGEWRTNIYENSDILCP